MRLRICLALVALGTMAAPAQQERHPRMRSAIRELRAVREELQASRNDLCGHRAAALKAADDALRQLQQAIECDH